MSPSRKRFPPVETDPVVIDGWNRWSQCMSAVGDQVETRSAPCALAHTFADDPPPLQAKTSSWPPQTSAATARSTSKTFSTMPAHVTVATSTRRSTSSVIPSISPALVERTFDSTVLTTSPARSM